MSTSLLSAGEPGAPRCSEKATGPDDPTGPQGLLGADHILDRLNFEVLPLLAAQQLLINCVRVHRAIVDHVTRQHMLPAGAEFEEQLGMACPTWADPMCNGGELDVLDGLARVIHDRAEQIVSEGMGQRGAA